MSYYAPSHRNTNDEQPEVCELCGSLVGRDHLRVAQVEGLQGRRVCDLHPFERDTVYRPSDNDYRRLMPAVQAPEAGQRLWPFGAELDDRWTIDPEDV